MDTFTFDDTGSPPGTNMYNTLIVIHGTGFHKGIFKRLLPLAHGQQIRLVLLNRRDYPGSKPFPKEDIDLIQSADPKQHAQFFSDRAIDLAEFVVEFAEKEHLPKIDASGTAGGVAIMAWSSGNTYSQPLLSLPEGISFSTKAKLDEYLRLYVIFDIPLWVLGYIYMPGLMSQLRDTSLPLEGRVKRFGHWVSAYYDHPSTTSRRREDLLVWPDDNTRSTVNSNMTESEFAEVTDYSALPRSEVSAQTVRPEVFKEWTRKAFFDAKMAREFFPRVHVVAVWGEKSHALCIEAAWKYQQLLEEYGSAGGRPLTIVMMPDANHFPHWDEPDRTMAFFANIVNGTRQSQ